MQIFKMLNRLHAGSIGPEKIVDIFCLIFPERVALNNILRNRFGGSPDLAPFLEHLEFGQI